MAVTAAALAPMAVRFVVPLVPPSANSYVRHSRGRHFRTAEAKAWDQAVALCAMGARIRAAAYSVTAAIYLGKGQRGDADNFWKVLLDGIARAGVIDSDAKVTRLVLDKCRDWANPRTEITVEAV